MNDVLHVLHPFSARITPDAGWPLQGGLALTLTGLAPVVHSLQGGQERLKFPGFAKCEAFGRAKQSRLARIIGRGGLFIIWFHWSFIFAVIFARRRFEEFIDLFLHLLEALLTFFIHFYFQLFITLSFCSSFRKQIMRM